LLKKRRRYQGQGHVKKKFCKQQIFASKYVVKSYINTYFPNTDHEVILSSFSWRIPALLAYDNPVPIAAIPIQHITYKARDSNYENFVVCYKANNEGYPSLVLNQVKNYLQTMPCDVRCPEPLFCHACFCILCGKIVSTNYGGCSYAYSITIDAVMR